MNRFIAPVVGSGFLLLFCTAAKAGSATWDLNPGSGDWNTAANWTPMTVPNGSADTATFALSNTTAVSISANTEVNGIMFDLGGSAYAITASPGLTLTLSGAGVVNNSGVIQNFVTGSNAIGFIEHIGQIFFTDSATAGRSTNFTNNGGTSFNTAGGNTKFFNNSSAADSTFTNNAITFSEAAEGGTVEFHDNSTAAKGTFINNGGIGRSDSLNGAVLFFDNSTAAHGVFTNNGGSGAPGATVFFGGAAASGTFTNNGAPASGGLAGFTAFQGNSTAASGTFTNNGGIVAGASGGETTIESTAANGTFTNNGGMVSGASGGETSITFGNAANGTFINNGATISGAGGGATTFGRFGGISTAGSATLIANGGTNGGYGGTIVFQGNSNSGTSHIEVFGNGSVDISLHNAPGMAINAIEGDGNVFLGANDLTVGSNNKDTTFSCAIQDGGIGGGTGGSLTKIGSGTVILSGANTYTGNTNINSGVLEIDGSIMSGNANVNGGVLKVDGSITSNTFVNSGGTLAGTGTIHGNVRTFKGGTVAPGDSLGTLNIAGNYSQPAGTLLIDIVGAGTGKFSVLNVSGSAHIGGILDPVLLNGFIPTIDEQFVFLNYGSLLGGFGGIQDQTFGSGTEHWAVTYESTDAILTAESGPAPIPDRGSTLLLLTLGLLGLVTYRQALLRTQS